MRLLTLRTLTKRGVAIFGKLKNLLSKSTTSVGAIEKNGAVVKELQMMAKSPTIKEGLKSFKESPEMMRKIEKLQDSPEVLVTRWILATCDVGGRLTTELVYRSLKC